MNKTEEQAREMLKKYLDNDEARDAYIASKTIYLSIEDVEIILNRFANSQPLNFDVKVDDELNPVSKPLGYGKEHYADLHVTDQKKWNAYDKARTIRERFADLTKERDELKTSLGMTEESDIGRAEYIKELEEQLQAVTKERDELKEELNYLKGRPHSFDVYGKLQAEKKRVEELRETLNRVDMVAELKQPIQLGGKLHLEIKKQLNNE